MSNNFAASQIGAMNASGGSLFNADSKASISNMSGGTYGAIPNILAMDTSEGAFAGIAASAGGANGGGGSCPSTGNFGSSGIMGIPGMSNLVSECMSSDEQQLAPMINLGLQDGQFPGATSAGLGSGGGAGSAGGGSNGFLGGLGAGLGNAAGGGIMSMLGGLV